MNESNEKTALITGAGRGIGSEIAIHLAQKGIKVAINYKSSKESALRVVAEINASGGTAQAYQCDVSDFKKVSEMTKAVKQDLGPVGILVNNSGIVKDFSILRMQMEDWDQVIGTNLSGAFYCTKSVVFDMMKKGWGRIINIGSLSWYNSPPGQVNYASSKAGLVGLTRSLASELAPTGITVNLIIPGLIETEITGDIPGEKLKAVTERIPAGRIGKAYDIARIAGFLADKDSDYITGQLITADGGLSCAFAK